MRIRLPVAQIRFQRQSQWPEQSGDCSFPPLMLVLEQTTLFYYNFPFRTFDKPSAGVIKSWAADVRPPITAPARTSKSGSATLVSKSSRAKVPVELVPSKPVQQPTKNRKPISQPLRLIDTSDEEFLAGRPSNNRGGTVSHQRNPSLTI